MKENSLRGSGRCGLSTYGGKIKPNGGSHQPRTTIKVQGTLFESALGSVKARGQPGG